MISDVGRIEMFFRTFRQALNKSDRNVKWYVRHICVTLSPA